VQNKYPYLYSHPVNVTFLSYEIGKWLNLSQTELYNLACAAFLHDIGKAKIRDSLLNKAEELSSNEMEIMRTHSIIGYQLLEKLNVLDQEILLGILHHHERIDGSGYPMGLKGNQISINGRIIAIADIFDAATSTKAYHEKSSPFKAVEEIEASGFASLDPFICQTFVNNSIKFYYKSLVKLSNEKIGEIIYINPEEKTKPLIRCENEYHNLSKERNLAIIDVL
jgi:putative nucleotidyltransferase with HDIG domain